MIDSISPLATPHDAGLGDASLGDARDKGAAPVAAPQRAKTAASSIDSAASKIRPATRLLIDREKDTGNFIYRVVEAATGRLLQEIPRQRVEDLKTAVDYVAGALIATDA